MSGVPYRPARRLASAKERTGLGERYSAGALISSSAAIKSSPSKPRCCLAAAVESSYEPVGHTMKRGQRPSSRGATAGQQTVGDGVASGPWPRWNGKQEMKGIKFEVSERACTPFDFSQERRWWRAAPGCTRSDDRAFGRCSDFAAVANRTAVR